MPKEFCMTLSYMQLKCILSEVHNQSCFKNAMNTILSMPKSWEKKRWFYLWLNWNVIRSTQEILLDNNKNMLKTCNKWLQYAETN